MIDLSIYSFQELRTLSYQVQQQLSSREVHDRERARQEIFAIAQGAGIDLKDLAQTKLSIKKLGPVPARYYNPADVNQKLWSGRGRQPRWFTELLKSGKTKDDLRIR